MGKVYAIAALVAAAAFTVGSGIARADWSDNFNGSFQQTWTLFDDAGNNTIAAASTTSGTMPTYDYDTSDQFLGMSANNTTTGFLGGFVSENFTDVRVSGIVNPAGATLDSDVGLVARADLGSGNAYNVLVAPDGTLALIKIAAFSSTVEGGTAITGFNASSSYLVDLYAVGPASNVDLSAHVYDANTHSLLASLSFQDTAGFASGASGVLTTQESSNAVDASWDDVASTSSVPEPAALSLLGIGALALIRRRRSA